MKQKIIGLLQNMFGVALMFSVLVGALVGVIYVIGFVIGGGTGEQMALLGGEIMKLAIAISAIGCVLGILAVYMEGIHELTMDANEDVEG